MQTLNRPQPTQTSNLGLALMPKDQTQAEPVATTPRVIDGITVNLTTPFAAGPVELNETEAAVLNRKRCDNMYTLVFNRIKKLRDADGNISEPDMAALHDYVTELNTNYRLSPIAKASTARSPYEKMLAKVAKEMVKALLVANGIKNSQTIYEPEKDDAGNSTQEQIDAAKDASITKFNDLVAEMSAQSECIEEAKRQLALAEATSKMSLSL